MRREITLTAVTAPVCTVACEEAGLHTLRGKWPETGKKYMMRSFFLF